MRMITSSEELGKKDLGGGAANRKTKKRGAAEF